MRRNESLVSITDYSKEEILEVLETAKLFEKNPNRHVLDGKVIATLFFEPSTRTRLSFETAVNRLGGRVIGFSDASTTSSTKGETLKDTIIMVSNYVDLIIMRHYLDGAARYASEVSPKPIINAGDGSNQHPSQTMLDLYSIYKTQGTLENLNITMVGDLKYGRTVHSLLMAMSHFHPTFHFVAPEELKMPEEYKLYCDKLGIAYARVVESVPDFALPSDPMEWHPTCHHDDPKLMELAEFFAGFQKRQYLKLMYVWGHSYEFDDRNNWDVIEGFCRYMGGRDDIWYATNIEIIDYMEAAANLKFSADYGLVYNPGALSVWIQVNDKACVELKGGSLTDLSSI